MRQEQSMIKKKLNIDYTKTHNIDIVNIYFNIRRFMFKNEDNINKSKKKKTSKTNLDINKFYIDKLYIKINDKINELLA